MEQSGGVPTSADLLYDGAIDAFSFGSPSIGIPSECWHL